MGKFFATFRAGSLRSCCVIILILTLAVSLGCNSESDDQSSQTKDGKQAAVETRVLEAALSFPPFQEYLHFGAEGRDTLYISFSGYFEARDLAKEAHPVVFVDSCAHDHNCLEVKNLARHGDTVHVELNYQAEGVICDLWYVLSGDDLELDSSWLAEI